jgi:MSHA biogenesis protein MshE
LAKGRDISSVTFKQGTGCPHCHNTGYKGRVGVFELLELNHPMAEALRLKDINGFTKAANESANFVPLSQVALQYAIQGITSLEEVMSISAQVDVTEN